GDEILQNAGVKVEFHHKPDAEALYKDFFITKRQGVPEVTVKVSCSLDGKQATDSGESKWITNKTVKQDVFMLRHKHDAVITGTGTLNADNPQYTTRIEQGKQPIRVILSKSGEVDFTLDIFQQPTTPIWIFTENKNLKNQNKNIEIIYCSNCTIENILKQLYQNGIGRVLVEAGPTITSEFLQSNFTNELILYYAPKIIGGSGDNQFFKTKNVFNLSDVPQFEIVNSKMLEQNIKLELRKKLIIMFTGIVEEIGTIKKVTTQQAVVNLTIDCRTILSDMHIGDSISVNGVCLTVIQFDERSFSVQVIKGTENKTY